MKGRPALVFAVALSCACASFSKPRFHGNTFTRTEEEAGVLRRALEREYPRLPPDQRKIIDRGLFFVVDYQEPRTSRFGGFGPEDDPAYRGDQLLYPQGTIKVNATLKTIERERLADKVPDARVQAVLRAEFRIFLVHEIEHVEEYIDDPPNDLKKDPSECLEGICNEERLEGTRKKMEYEFQALRRHFREVTSTLSQEEVNYAAKWLEAHPELLTERVKNEPVQLAKLDVTKPIGDAASIFYSGMYRPAVLAKTCASLGKLTSEEREEAATYFKFNEGHKNMLLDAYRYLPPVFERLRTCME